MELEKNLWIYPYKMGSASARALAEECDIWMIKREGSQWKGSPGRTVLNWGAGTGVFQLKLGEARLLNTPNQVDIAVNKLVFFRSCMGDLAPRLPFWTDNSNVARSWLASGLTVLARTELEGSKGSGLIVMKPGVDFSQDNLYTVFKANLYTVRVDSTDEYRVYMFNGEVLDTRVKLLQEGQEPHPDGMRYEDKYQYCRLKDGAVLPPDASLQAKRAIQKVGLFTGGVDVLYDSKTGLATVVEVNSAPYIGGDTAKKYKEAFVDYFENEAA